MDAPYFKFYPSDWLSDSSVQFMSLEEEGAYIRLLCYAWNEGDNCGLPDDDKFISRLLKVSTRKWAKLKQILFAGNHAVFEKKSDGLMHNKRLDEEWLKVQQRSKNAVIAANSRWGEDEKEVSDAMQTQCERIPSRIASEEVSHGVRNAISEVIDLDPEKQEREIARARSQVVAAYEQVMGPLQGESNQLDLLLNYVLDGMDQDLIIHAIRKSSQARAPAKYANSILWGYKRQGIMTLERANEAERVNIHYESNSRASPQNRGTRRRTQSITKGEIGRV